MGLHRDSLISLVTFSSRGSKKGHERVGSSSRRSVASAGSLDDDLVKGHTPLSSLPLTSSSGDLLHTPKTAQTLLDSPPRFKLKPLSPTYESEAAEANPETSISTGDAEGLRWELLHDVLCNVSSEHPDFFAVCIDSTKTWYRGYLFQSESELGRLVPFAVKVIRTLGEPANDWLARQSCSRSLKDSVRIVSLEWLFAIPGQRMTELKLTQLIGELRRLKDADQQVQFMNQVNIVLGLPIFSRTQEGEVMPVGKYTPLNVIEQQVSITASPKIPNDERKIEELLPRDIEVELVEYDATTPLSQCILRLHLRHVTPLGKSGKRLSDTFEVAFGVGMKCAFKHLTPASPSLLAKTGRIVLVCELVDIFTARYLGSGIARMDSVLLPESLNRTFELSVSMYVTSKPENATVASLYKSLITGGATSLRLPEVVKELTFTVTSRSSSHPSFPAVSSTVNDYLNQAETAWLDFGELVITKQPSILALSANDPFLIRIEDHDVPAVPGNEVGFVLKRPVPLSHVDIQLLNGSTVVASNKANSRAISVAADTHRVPLFDVGDESTMIGFVNVHQTYTGRKELQPPPVVAAIITEHAIDYNLQAISELGLVDLKLWADLMITSILSQLLEDTTGSPGSQRLFKAFVILLYLGLQPEARYLFELYEPSRRLLAAPVASILLQHYCILLETRASELQLVFEAHLLLSHFLEIFSASANEFRPLTQAFMVYFSDESASHELLKLCLQHIDELYVVNTDLEIASQIGSVLTAASYILIPPVVAEFYWLLARISRSRPYRTVFAQQFSSLVLSLTERFWEEAGTTSQSLDEIRAMMALMAAFSSASVEAPAFLSLCMGVLITNEPSFRAVPNGPLFKPHRVISSSNESERATAMIETCLVIYELTDPKFPPSRAFLKRLEGPLDLVYQLCSCAHIMADSLVPYEWMSLNCGLLHCALRCAEYAGAVLQLVALPDSPVQANLLDKTAWKRVLTTLLELLSDPRLNYGLIRTGMRVSPIQRVAVDQSLLLSGLTAFGDLWRALAKDGEYGGYQVQFYNDYDLWGHLLLVGFNAAQPGVCEHVAGILARLLDGEYKLYGTSDSEALRTLLLSLDYMFRNFAAMPSEKLGLTWSVGWPRFASITLLFEALCRHISDATFDAYGDAAAIALKGFDILCTYWSAPYSRGTLVALWELLEFIHEFDAYYLFEKYFGEFVLTLRKGEETDKRLAIIYFEAAQFYSTADALRSVGASASPRLPPQPVHERRHMLITMSLQHCVKAQVWGLAERVMEAEAQWLKDSNELEKRSQFVTKWLPKITVGLTLQRGEEGQNWYLLEFHGDAFGVLSGREFIWETRLRTRLTSAIQMISSTFNDVACLPWDSSPRCRTTGAHISILTLTKSNDQYLHLRPIRDQHTEVTELKCMASFPSASGFVEVANKHVYVLGPGATALRDVRTKTEELRAVSAPQRFKQLDLVLSGILNAGVNGGMSRYTDLLGSDEELAAAFRELKVAVDRALVIYEQGCGEELRGQYELLRERARQWQTLNSLESGFI